MHSPLRIAVLECDEPVGETKKQYYGFGNLFRKLFEAGVSRLAEDSSYCRPELDISAYDVMGKQEYPDIESIDAVLLTGSRTHVEILSSASSREDNID